MTGYPAESRCSFPWYWRQDEALRFLPSENIGSLCTEKDGLTLEQWLERYPHIRNSADWAALFQAQRERRHFSDFIYPSPSNDAGWLRICGKPLFDASNQFCGYEGVIDDVTVLYQELLDAKLRSDHKSTFIANVSHEIKTPLTAVLGVAEILEQRLSDFDEREMASTIRRSADRLVNMLNDLLDLSKVEAGELDIETRAFSPVQLVCDVVKLFHNVAQSKNINLEFITDHSSSELRIGDPFRTQQILNNLISNAIKFTHQGEVSIQLSLVDPQNVSIVIKDSGIGMHETQIANLPTPYRQGGLHVAREYGGIGLGLAICYSLIDLLAGRIVVKSRANYGTSIEVVLPFPAIQEPVKTVELAGNKHDLQGLHILIAGDDPAHLQLLELTLADLGAEVYAVRDGVAALAAWVPQAFDAVILDITRSENNTPTTVAALRSLEAMHALQPRPIIAVSADVMADQVMNYIVAGFDTCLPKPIVAKDLCSCINTLIAYDCVV